METGRGRVLAVTGCRAELVGVPLAKAMSIRTVVLTPFPRKKWLKGTSQQVGFREVERGGKVAQVFIIWIYYENYLLYTCLTLV